MQEKVLYITENVNWNNLVKCGKTTIFKGRQSTLQTPNPEPVCVRRVYQFLWFANGWNLNKLDDNFKANFSEYNHISDAFKVGNPRSREFYRKEIIGLADNYMEKLKNENILDYVKFTSRETYLVYLEENCENDKYYNDDHDFDYDENNNSDYDSEEENKDCESEDGLSDDDYEVISKIENIIS